jgi:hypothetical protein
MTPGTRQVRGVDADEDLDAESGLKIHQTAAKMTGGSIRSLNARLATAWSAIFSCFDPSSVLFVKMHRC